eukprot:gene7712-880_t
MTIEDGRAAGSVSLGSTSASDGHMKYSNGWPFVRVLGLQHIVSAMLSVAAALVHLACLFCVVLPPQQIKAWISRSFGPQLTIGTKRSSLSSTVKTWGLDSYLPISTSGLGQRQDDYAFTWIWVAHALLHLHAAYRKKKTVLLPASPGSKKPVLTRRGQGCFRRGPPGSEVPENEPQILQNLAVKGAALDPDAVQITSAYSSAQGFTEIEAQGLHDLIMQSRAGEATSAAEHASEGAQEVAGTSRVFIIVDVRTEEEFNSGHIQGAVNISLDNLSSAVKSGVLEKWKDATDASEAVYTAIFKELCM